VTAVDDLDAHLAGDTPQWDEPPAPPAGTVAASGMLRSLDRLRRQLAEARETAAGEHARVDEWLRAVTERVTAQTAWLETALALYHQHCLLEDPARKTIDLPAGTLKARAQQPEWQFDPDKFVTWAALNDPTLLRRRPAPAPEIDKTKAKTVLADHVKDGRVVTAAGEIVPGVAVVERGRKYTAETGDAR
jgi:hypothetical protein